MHCWCWQSVAAGPFWPCFACPKLGDAGRTRVASKNRAVLEWQMRRWLFTIFPKVDFFTCRWIRAIFVLTFSPSGENVNTNMALIHRQVKKRNIPFYIKNDMGPNDSLTDGRKSYDCDEKYHIQNWQEGALFSFTLRWKIVVSVVTFHHLVNI